MVADVDGLYIIRTDEVLTVQPGVGAGAAVQCDGGPGAAAILDPGRQLLAVVLRLATGDNQLHHVLLHRVGHMQHQRLRAGAEHRFLAQRSGCRGGAGIAVGFGAGQTQDGRFRGGIRVVHVDVQQEAVELGLGQGVGALLLDGVLGCHDQKQGGQLIGLAAHTHLPFRHRLQQCRLHLGRGAVHLVGQHQVVKDGALLKMEAALLGPVNLGTRDIAGQQVGGELDAVEASLQPLGQRFDGARLGQPRRPFDQQVAVGKQRDDQSLYQVRLTDDLCVQPAFKSSDICACHAFSRVVFASVWISLPRCAGRCEGMAAGEGCAL